jgi:hypothetical protein
MQQFEKLKINAKVMVHKENLKYRQYSIHNFPFISGSNMALPGPSSLSPDCVGYFSTSFPFTHSSR